MRYILLTSATGLALSACTTEVKTAEQAVAIGAKACDDAWGKEARKNGADAQIHLENWHARLDEDRWKVWYGPNEARTGMYIYVRQDGRPPNPENDCEMIFTD
jgi:hypothetical protein